MSAAKTISLLRAHCDANDKRERATFSIASIRELLAFVDDCAATIKPFPPLPSREVGGKASMSRELLGAVVDDVFDGAIEDPSVIEDIYASIKRHEGALSTDAEPVGEPLELPYKNWRGEISTRKIQPIRLEFGATEWHPEPQWLLVATDIEKNVERSFALKDFNPQQTVPAVAVKDACAPDLLLYNLLMEAINEGVAKATDPNWTTKDFSKSPYYQAIHAALSAQVQDARSDDEEETYQIGVRDGYSQAVQEIDRLTGGDGEYRYCTDHDPERHTPGPAEMIQRIVDRFETLNLIGEAEKRGDFWDAPGSAQVQDEVVPDGWQLVPEEPTEEMHNAARDWAVKKYGLGIGFDGSDGCYRAMLAAAPASPASKHGDAS